MHRVGKLLLGAAAVVVLLGVAGTGEQRAVSPILLLLGVGAVGWAAWAFVQRRRPIAAGGWAPAAAISYRPARVRPEGGSAGVPMALARVEVRELTGSTAFGVGLGFCGLALFLFGWVWVGDYGGDVPAMLELLPILAHPLAGMVVLASFRARTRGQRDGVEELFSTCPTTDSARTRGHLLTGWAPALTALAYSALMIGFVVAGSPTPFGEVGVRQVAALLGAGVLCLGATALGVALARWLPWTLVPVAAVIAVGFASVELATTGDRVTEPLRQLSTWLGEPEVDVRLTAPHWLAHHLWIVGLVAVVTVLALLRDSRRPAVMGTGLLAVAVAAASAIVATRPIDSDDARRIASVLTDPAQLPCLDAGGLDVCTFVGDEELQRALASAVTPVVAAAPPGVLDGWSVRQTADTDREALDPQVRALLGPPPTDEKVIPIEFTGHPLALQGLRMWAGLTATGALESWVGNTTLGLRGQARGVVAIWLATRGAPRNVQLALTSLGTPDRAARDASRPWPDTCAAGPAPVRWAATDVAAARRLVELPEAQVQSVVLADWEHLTDRRTSTDDLLVALGLEPTGVSGDTPEASEC